MDETILIAQGRDFSLLPRSQWEEQLAQVPGRMKVRLDFMTRDHHRVRYFVVRELPRSRESISAELISAALRLPVRRVNQILEELEGRLFFLVRDRKGNVSWAFPVTVDRTPHELKFSTGEQIYAA